MWILAKEWLPMGAVRVRVRVWGLYRVGLLARLLPLLLRPLPFVRNRLRCPYPLGNHHLSHLNRFNNRLHNHRNPNNTTNPCHHHNLGISLNQVRWTGTLLPRSALPQVRFTQPNPNFRLRLLLPMTNMRGLGWRLPIPPLTVPYLNPPSPL